MRNAKYVLLGVLILAISGVCLAFKTQQKLGAIIYLCPDTESPATTTIEATITAENAPGASQTLATTTISEPCGLTFTIARD